MPIKNFEENGAWAYPGAAQFFWVHPIISRTCKATELKFGKYIYRTNRNISIQKLPKFFGYHLLSQERVKLRTANLAGTFTGPIRIKAH